ncbi:hypothetical protein TRFO_37546 [Tritrichomonas foetus]|uniref:Phosphoprotein phosphatase n=1 Tax=Tritrichomonas foetus TaxID=1144522 RepID=A0A1J4JGG7_9EUKA|nr:hypothetical protein TRFO_37546 [Tritrichomonas foetus]|eukprot:OHS96300.1 hypothetical protein TRFO_37546 [Tritrichomonas foetus]
MFLLSRLPERHSQILVRQPQARLRASQARTRFNSARIATLAPLNPEEKQFGSLPIDAGKGPPSKRNSEGNSGYETMPKQSQVEPVADEIIPMNYTNSSLTTSRSGADVSKLLYDAGPPLPPSDSPNFQKILDQKLSICNFICNFYNPDVDVEAKKVKSSILEDIVNCLSATGMITNVDEQDLAKLVKMCQNNIVRRLPILDARTIFSNDIPPIEEPAWPHLNYVYQILRRIFQNFGYLNVFNNDFVISLLPILQSPDSNERSALGGFITTYMKGKPACNTVLLPHLKRNLEEHCVNHSPPFIVGPILNLYLQIFQTGTMSNILLADAFQQTLRVLSDYHLSHFERQLKNLVEFFTDESMSFAAMFVKTLILKWPKSCAEKEASFIRMMTETIPKMSSRELSPLIHRIFSIYAECSCSHATKVAEAALQIWANLQMEPIIQEHGRKIVPLMYGPVSLALKEHWSKPVRESAATALRMMSKISPRAVQDLNTANSSNSGNESRFAPTAHDDLKKWANIARTAARRDHEVNLGKKLADITMLYNGQQKQFMQTHSGGSQRAMSMRQQNFYGARF